MLGRSIQVFRTSALQSQSSMLASRRFDYANPSIRNKKHKMAAKERRRVKRAAKGDENKTPADKGEELPPFMIPQRYKLIFKYL